MKYVITNGSKYVARNPYYPNQYFQADSKDLATQFTSKQARRLLGTNNKKMKWIKSDFYVQEFVDEGTGKVLSKREIKRKSNGNCFLDYDLDETLLMT